MHQGSLHPFRSLQSVDRTRERASWHCVPSRPERGFPSGSFNITKVITMATPAAPPSFRARVREYLRELAFNLLDLQHRLFDPLDPNSMPDYRKELQTDAKDAHKPRELR